MNITHAEEEIVVGDRLEAIFSRQKELMEKYHHIEAKSGLCQTEDCPVNLDDRRGQARIKDFAWRITEELGEALDASNDLEHNQEELIDGLHFLTELTILVGRDYNTICSDFSPEDTNEVDYLEMLYSDSITSSQNNIADFIMNLGMMCNCLKNKPWKQTQMITDKNQFYYQLEKTWISYIAILRGAGLTPDDIVNIYLKKSQVNKFRQRSNY